MKDIVFFSNYCDFSKEIINLLVRKNMKEQFLFVCVDANKYQLPDFVDRVPLLYTKSKHVLVDQSIMDYIEDISPKPKDIEPFSIMQGTGNYSDMFSFIDSVDEGVTKGYTYLTGNHDKIMLVPDDTSDKNGTKSKFDSSSFDKYLQDRDNDIKKIMGSGNPAVRF